MAKGTRRVRQRVEVKKMQNEEQLQVTFSQRPLGLFKMANQMCILTGAQVALVVFSPSNKVLAFGSPDVKSVIDRYEDQSHQPHDSHHLLVQSRLQANQEKLNTELSLLEKKVEGEKKRRKLLDQMIEENKRRYWWEAAPEDLDLNQLEELLRAMKELYNDVTEKMHAMLIDYLNSHQVPFNFGASAAHDFIHNATNPSRINSVSAQIMGRCSSNQRAPFDSMAPETMDFCKNASVPSLINGLSSSTMGQSSSNGLATFDSGES